MTDPARFVEVRIGVARGLEELAAEAFCAPPFTALATGDGVVVGHVSQALDSPALRSELEARLASLGATSIEFVELPAQDFEPRNRAFRVGRLCIVPRGAAPRLRPTDVALALDPAGAFGTGRHPTTRACLRLLQRLPLAGARVLDAGTGSGILAVAAAKLGAEFAIGFDVDPNSRPTAEALAAENGVAGRTRFLDGGFEDLPGDVGLCDGLVANLYLDLLIDHARDLAARLEAGGWFVLSGVRAKEEATLRAALDRAGLAVERAQIVARWIAMSGRKPRA